MSLKDSLYQKVKIGEETYTLRKPNLIDVAAYGTIPDIFQDKAVFENQEKQDQLASDLSKDPKKFQEIYGFIQHIICASVVAPVILTTKKLNKCAADEIPVNDLPIETQMALFTAAMNKVKGGDSGLSPESFPAAKTNPSETPSNP